MIIIKQKDLTIKDFDKLDNNSDTGILIPESDYGLAEIYLRNGKFELYEIPMYGGEPQLAMIDSNAQIIIAELNSWC